MVEVVQIERESRDCDFFNKNLIKKIDCVAASKFYLNRLFGSMNCLFLVEK